MAQQRLGRWRPAAEGGEHIRWSFAAAAAQHRVAEAPAGGLHGLLIVEPSIFKGAEGIGAEHLSPLVAVVAGAVAPREDVAKAAQQGVFFQERQHGGGFRHLAPQLLWALAIRRRATAHAAASR